MSVVLLKVDTSQLSSSMGSQPIFNPVFWALVSPGLRPVEEGAALWHLYEK